LGNYVFVWEDNKFAVALGYGSLYNHSYEPNAKYIRKKDKILFQAIKDIKSGEEITINYNGNPKSQDKVWFDVK
jgi:SET domain-containing protein